MFLPPLSGWRRGPAGSSVPSVKRASAERKSSHCTAEGAPAKRTPGTPRVLCTRMCVLHASLLVAFSLFLLLYRLKTPPRPQGQRTEPESRGGVSESTCFLLLIITEFSFCLVFNLFFCLCTDVPGFRGHRLSHVLRHWRFPLRLLHDSLQHQRPLSQSR